MNTPAHMIFGAAAFGRPGQPRVTAAAILGSFLPDLSLFLMVGFSIYIQGIDRGTVFGQLYYSDLWQRIFAVDNSFLVWSGIFAIGYFAKRPIVTAFAAAGLLHLTFDFMLHNQDARMQFWPLSDWIFRSPFSYWDPNYYGGVIGPAEIILSVLLCGLMLWRFKSWRMRAVILLMGAAEILTSHIWHTLF